MGALKIFNNGTYIGDIGNPIHPTSNLSDYMRYHEWVDWVPILGIYPMLLNDNPENQRITKNPIKLPYHCVSAVLIGGIIGAKVL